jgi:glycosyltransferase involved in cell wall biosynthesis
MKNILLINKEEIPHYRVPVYNYLSEYLKKQQFHLTVISGGVQRDNPHVVEFPYQEMHLCFKNLARLCLNTKPDAVIYWINFELYKFPLLLLLKILHIKTIYWGHGRDLQQPRALIKNLVYSLEHKINDAMILYAEHLRVYVSRRAQSKTFVANNTLNLTMHKSPRLPKEDIKKKYGIYTKKNIICIGRIQQRKRIGDLLQAFRLCNIEEAGLILVGPDSDGILENIEGGRVFKLGSVYGDDSLDLLSISDVYCLPGAIGLGIVDAFYCGLPAVTEDVNHGPEIMYLKDGINGFIVPKGNIALLAEKLRILLTDDALRELFSKAARTEVTTTGHIDRMCEGFLNALQYVCKSK